MKLCLEWIQERMEEQVVIASISNCSKEFCSIGMLKNEDIEQGF